MINVTRLIRADSAVVSTTLRTSTPAPAAPLRSPNKGPPIDTKADSERSPKEGLFRLNILLIFFNDEGPPGPCSTTFSLSVVALPVSARLSPRCHQVSRPVQLSRILKELATADEQV